MGVEMTTRVKETVSTMSAPNPTPLRIVLSAAFSSGSGSTSRSESWLGHAQYRIKEAFQQRDDWDHEGAAAVSLAAAESALELATQLTELKLLKPFIQATRSGGIAFEWIGGPFDLLIEVLESDLEVSIRDRTSGEYWEGKPDTFEDEFLRALASVIS